MDGHWFSVSSYVVAAVAYGAVGVLLLVNRPRGRRAFTLIAAVLASMLWAVLLTLLLVPDHRGDFGIDLLQGAHGSLHLRAVRTV